MRLFFFFLLTLSFSSHVNGSTELLKSNFKEDFKLDKKEAADFFQKEIPEYLKNFKSNGSWKDINYRLDDNKFTPGKHAARMDYLARAYKSPTHTFYNDRRLLPVILKAYDYWLNKDIRSYNWWHNTIGIPRRYAKVMILMEKELGAKRIRKGLSILDRAHISRTGQNRLWYSELVFIRSLFDGKVENMKKAAREFYALVKLSSRPAGEEGVQADLSFHQHGALIYNGGYGSKFSLIVARLINILSGTKYSFPADKVKTFSRYILDAQIWMTRADKWDYSVTGREITRKGKDAYKLRKVCRILKDLPLPRKNEFRQCYNSLENSHHYLSGNKAFWRSDYMVHHRNSYFASLRMYSNRLINNDAPSNSEGLMSHYLADGATYFMRRGDEYEDIFPVWDWNLIPGTTTEVKKLKPAFYEPGNWDAFAHIRYMGSSSFVGQVSTGAVGLGAMDFVSNKRYEKVDVKKSYFFLNDGIYVQGTDLSCRGCRQVVTTVDQKNLRGKVYVLTTDGRSFEHKGRARKYNKTKAVYHDGFVYYFPVEQEVVVSAGKQKGNWARINGQYDRTSVEKPVFKLYIEHRNDFSYAVFPNKKLSELGSIKIASLKADKSQHQLRSSRYEMLSFFKKGRVDTLASNISVDQACLIVLDKKMREAYLSDPTQSLTELSVTIDGRKHQIQLPRGANSGKTISFKY